MKDALDSGEHPEAIELPLKALPPKVPVTKPEAETEDETEKRDPTVSSPSNRPEERSRTHAAHTESGEARNRAR